MDKPADEKGDLRRFVAQFPDLARSFDRVLDALYQSCCPGCRRWREHNDLPHHPDCILTNLRTAVREQNAKETSHRA